jgi:hypothetical protein
MSSPIRLVRGDNRPYIKLRLYQSDGTILNISDAGITVAVRFRSVTTETILTTISCTKLNGGVNGECRFNVPLATLNAPAGPYEGEVVVDFGGETQTVYDRLKFQVRERFEVA